jgi:hypothetical protein
VNRCPHDGREQSKPCPACEAEEALGAALADLAKLRKETWHLRERLAYLEKRSRLLTNMSTLLRQMLDEEAKREGG